MFNKNEVIKDDQDIDYCIHLKTPLIVWQDGSILDYGGVPESYTDDAIRINGAYYLRINCEFKVR